MGISKITPVSTDQQFDVVVARRVVEAAWWSGVSRAFESVVAAVPTHRDSASGRRNAAQVRTVMLGTGVAVVVLSQSPWAPLALVLCVLALVVPMSESRRRQLTARLRAGRVRSAVERTPAVLVLDSKHVTLGNAGEPVRRLRRSALELTYGDDLLELRAGAKKRDRFIVVDHGSPDEEMWVEGDREAIRGALQRQE